MDTPLWGLNPCSQKVELGIPYSPHRGAPVDPPDESLPFVGVPMENAPRSG